MTTTPPKRTPGRPRRVDAPQLPVGELDALLVDGEPVTGADGKRRRVFLSFRALAERFGVAHSQIGRFAADHDCLARRARKYAKQPTDAAKRPLAPTASEETSAPKAPAARPVGRPTRTTAPDVPLNELDRLLVFGELRASDVGSGQIVVFPTVTELAERFGVSTTYISRYATTHNCRARREVAVERVQARVDEKLIELNAVSIADIKTELQATALAVVREVMKNLERGGVRVDDPRTIAEMGNFILSLEGAGDRRPEGAHGISLDELRARHHQLVEDARRRTVIEAGVVEPTTSTPTAQAVIAPDLAVENTPPAPTENEPRKVPGDEVASWGGSEDVA
jgi:hypothetical protein